MGYIPVQQGTGTNQLANAVKIGWTGSRLAATVDITNLGNIVFDSHLATKQDSLNGGTIPAGANLNDYRASRIYTLAGSYTNSPVTYGLLFCLNTGSSYTAQIVIGSNAKLYYRFKNDQDVFGSWMVVTASALS